MATTAEPKLTDATGPQGFFTRASQLPEVAARQKALNRSKRPAFIPRAIDEMSRKSQLYIFNVGPKPQEGNGASYGRVMIQPCPPDREYSDPFVVPGLPHEYYNKEGNTLDPQFHGDGEMEEPGWDWACQAINGFTDAKGEWNGKFLAPRGSLEKFGVGISRTWPPSKADIKLARDKMLKEYAFLVQQANEAHAMGKASSVLTDDHFTAAHVLGKTAQECRWLEFSASIETRQNCPKCQKPYDTGTVEHDCGFILNKKQYDEWVTQGLIAARK